MSADIWIDEPVVDNRPIVTEEPQADSAGWFADGFFDGGWFGSGQGERWTEEALP